MDINNIGEMNAHFLSCFPREGCGVVVNNKFEACENVYDKEELHNFRIRRGDYFKHDKDHGVQAVIHSHTHSDKQFDVRTPTMSDMEGQIRTAVPWAIVATSDGEHVSPPLWFGLKEPAPIEGRFYMHNVYDCLTCVLDYVKINFDVDCEVVPRPMQWENLSKNLIVDNVETCGFHELPRDTKISDLREGDAILFKVQASYVNHCGVVAEDGMFWHQMMGRYTKKDHIARWEKQIAAFVRHEDLA
jgi:proteasome lid subunit RPN8/RPN11